MAARATVEENQAFLAKQNLLPQIVECPLYNRHFVGGIEILSHLILILKKSESGDLNHPKDKLLAHRETFRQEFKKQANHSGD